MIIRTITCLCLIALAGCTRMIDYEHDNYAHIDKQMYDDLLRFVPNETAPIPSTNPKPTKKLPAAFHKKISVSLSPGSDLTDYISTVAGKLGINVVIEEKIITQHQAQLKDVTFLKLLEYGCDISNMAYKINDNMVRIWKDTPYSKTYSLPMLAMNRNSQNKTSVMSQLGAIGKDGNTMNNGSESYITSEISHNYYNDLKQNLTSILQEGKGKWNHTINAQSGLITINAPQKLHNKVKKYLTTLKSSTSAQVLIEAKILEVKLNDRYRSGINWSLVNEKVSSVFKLTGGTKAAAPGGYNLQLNKDSLGSFLSLLHHFGTSRTLSNPRVTVMNNQPALLKMAQNYVYFNLEYETISVDEAPINQVKSQAKTVPIGLMLSVLPSIDTKTNHITLNLRPTLTTITGKVKDPAVTFAARDSDNPIESEVPIVEVREMDSVMSVKSGNVAVFGGIMQERVNNKSTGLPGFTDGPLSPLFSAKDDEREVVELVFLLKATYLDDKGNAVAPADVRLFNTFSEDPRPAFKK